jgi:sugar phosphate isomerase/epimerase
VADRVTDELASGSIARRQFLQAFAATIGGAALTVPRGSARVMPAAVSAAPSVKLGIASYSLRSFSRPQAIEMLRALRASYVNIKSMHLPYAASAAEISSARNEFSAAGLAIVGGGTITFEQDTDESVNAYFAYAKAVGMPVIVATCAPTILPRVERHAIRNNIKVAIHNHGPEDPHYPSPYDVLKHVRAMDARMGLCFDIGHTVRTGTDVVAAIADAGPRLHDLHLKDLRDLRDRESQCVVGDGAIPIPAILRQLSIMRFAGCANLEYEIDANDPLPGMQRSLAYLRGALAAIDTPAKQG